MLSTSISIACLHIIKLLQSAHTVCGSYQEYTGVRIIIHHFLPTGDFYHMRWNNDDSPFIILLLKHKHILRLMHPNLDFWWKKDSETVHKANMYHSADGMESIEILSTNFVFIFPLFLFPLPHDLYIGVQNALYANRRCFVYVCVFPVLWAYLWVSEYVCPCA